MKASTRDFRLSILAAVIMFAGAVIIFTGSSALAFSLIAVGAAVLALAEVDRRRLVRR
jgi:uncharacterized membrane protein